MNRRLMLVLAIGTIGVVALTFMDNTRSPEVQIEKIAAIPMLVKDSKILNTTVTTAPAIQASSSLDPKENKLVIEYQEAAYKLASKLESLGLDGEELNELFNKVGKEDFLNHVPKEVRSDYLNLEARVHALGKQHLAQDGMTEKFFTKFHVEMPEWVKNQREEVEKTRLPTAVQDLVSKKTNEAELNNEEINNILNGCGKGNSDCINKAFATLIDANHGLDDNQLKMIQEYL